MLRGEALPTPWDLVELHLRGRSGNPCSATHTMSVATHAAWNPGPDGDLAPVSFPVMVGTSGQLGLQDRHGNNENGICWVCARCLVLGGASSSCSVFLCS